MKRIFRWLRDFLMSPDPDDGGWEPTHGRYGDR